MALVFGALADDLTGGLELAAVLASAGASCAFATTPAAAATLAGVDAIVLAQKTRVAPASDAVRRFADGADVLQQHGARQLFFKYCATFDSTDRGNIGPCADVLLRRTGAELTAFCPTLPEYQRQVFQGHLFAGDRLISDSPKRFDPLTPMTDPNLVAVLQRQTRERVGLIPHEVVRAGAEAIGAHARGLAASGVRYAIADAIYHDDLAQLAAATADWPLMTGNSSIAAHYPALWRARGWLAVDGAAHVRPVVDGPGVVLAGSCAPQTLAQLAAFGRDHPVRFIDMEAALSGEDVVAASLAWADRHLPRPIAIATSAPPEKVAALQERAGQIGAAQLAEQTLGRIAEGLCRRGVRRFVVAGGETSGAVLAHLGIERLAVGPFLAPWLPVAFSDGDAPLAFCLKSGKLAAEDAFAVALAGMTKGA